MDFWMGRNFFEGEDDIHNSNNFGNNSDHNLGEMTTDSRECDWAQNEDFEMQSRHNSFFGSNFDDEIADSVAYGRNNNSGFDNVNSNQDFANFNDNDFDNIKNNPDFDNDGLKDKINNLQQKSENELLSELKKTADTMKESGSFDLGQLEDMAGKASGFLTKEQQDRMQALLKMLK